MNEFTPTDHFFYTNQTINFHRHSGDLTHINVTLIFSLHFESCWVFQLWMMKEAQAITIPMHFSVNRSRKIVGLYGIKIVL